MSIIFYIILLVFFVGWLALRPLVPAQYQRAAVGGAVGFVVLVILFAGNVIGQEAIRTLCWPIMAGLVMAEASLVGLARLRDWHDRFLAPAPKKPGGNNKPGSRPVEKRKDDASRPR
jgi:hypothetical protein